MPNLVAPTETPAARGTGFGVVPVAMVHAVAALVQSAEVGGSVALNDDGDPIFKRAKTGKGQSKLIDGEPAANQYGYDLRGAVAGILFDGDVKRLTATVQPDEEQPELFRVWLILNAPAEVQADADADDSPADEDQPATDKPKRTRKATA
jgi:hypothetical protein